MSLTLDLKKRGKVEDYDGAVSEDSGNFIVADYISSSSEDELEGESIKVIHNLSNADDCKHVDKLKLGLEKKEIKTETEDPVIEAVNDVLGEIVSRICKGEEEEKSKMEEIVTSSPSRNKEVSKEHAKDVQVDLQQTWPFTHFRLTFTLQTSEEMATANAKESSNCWKFEQNKYVYYDTISTLDAENIKNKAKALRCQAKKKCLMQRQQQEAKRRNNQMMKLTQLQNSKTCSQNLNKVVPVTINESPLEQSDFVKAVKHDEVQGLDRGCIFTCPYCMETFWEATMLINHLANHIKRESEDENKKQSGFGDNVAKNNELWFQCVTCMKTFCTYSLLFRHKRMHDNARPFECDKCSYRFLRKEHLQFHKVYTHSDQRPFKCTMCNFSSKCNRGLKDHIQCVHCDERPFKCMKCPFACKCSSNLLSHMKTVHSTHKPFKCFECPYATKTSTNLRIHMRNVHSNEKPFKCRNCPFACKWSSNLWSHMKTVHSTHKPFKCPECPHATKTSTNLRIHMKTVHSTHKPFMCFKCPFATKTSTNLRLHVRKVHSDEKPFKCVQCPYACKSSSNLRDHMTVHHSTIKPFKCLECPFATKTSTNLRLHMKTHADFNLVGTSKLTTKNDDSNIQATSGFNVIASQINPCVVLLKRCDNVLAKYNLSRHQVEKNSDLNQLAEMWNDINSKDNYLRKTREKHNKNSNPTDIMGELKMPNCPQNRALDAYFIIQQKLLIPTLNTERRSFKCVKCSKSFKYKYSLKRHFLCHSGRKRTYKCDKCYRSFFDNQQLKSHLRSHTNLRPFQCTKCSKCFKYKNSLKRHILCHSVRKRTYKCDKCYWSFFDSQQLKLHLRSHTNLRPFQCTKCSKCFKYKKNLQRHIICHLGTGKDGASRVRLFKCGSCDQSFFQQSHLSRHMSCNHHKQTQFIKNTSPASSSETVSSLLLAATQNTKKSYKCKICSKTFTNLKRFKMHKSYHSSKKTEASISFTTNTTTAENIINQQQGSHNCEFCNRKFFTVSTLHRHMMSHAL